MTCWRDNNLNNSNAYNSIVIVDRDKYIKKMKKNLSEESKFQKTTVKMTSSWIYCKSRKTHQ